MPRKPILYLLVLSSVSLLAFSLSDDLTQSIKRGEQVYGANCLSCHQTDGAGVMGVFPPLAKSDYLMGDPKRAIRVVLHGLNGEITVNGEIYDQEMPAQSHLTDEQVADVLNYVRNSWGNKGAALTPAQVKTERKM